MSYEVKFNGMLTLTFYFFF